MRGRPGAARRLHRLLLISFCLGVGALCGPAARAEDVRAIAALIVNGTPQDDTTMVWRDGVVWVPATAGTLGWESSTGVSVMGAIVALDGRLHATRPVDDAFGVVKVGDVPGVRTYLSHQCVGRTNARGEVVVPNPGAGGAGRGGGELWGFGGCNDHLLTGV